MLPINTLPKRDISKSTTGCCPPFEPEQWDEQEIDFQNKLFMKISTRSVFHVPLNMGKAMTEAMAQIASADATNQEYLMLSEEVSPWYANHYIAVSKEVPGAEMVRLSGVYLMKVFEGPYSEMRKWHSQLVDYAASKGGLQPVKTYFCYTMCPNCAKAYEKNYVVGFAQTS